MQAWLSGLNPEQQKAVMSTEGYVRVLAGPGTGKTRALTARYCYLTETLGVSAKNILCVTFTNKAANEMKQRIRQWLGDLDYVACFLCSIFKRRNSRSALSEEFHHFGCRRSASITIKNF